VVGNEPGIASALAYLLSRSGYVVDTTANGRLALDKLQERTYDLMPGAGGCQHATAGGERRLVYRRAVTPIGRRLKYALGPYSGNELARSYLSAHHHQSYHPRS
jgi:hypothetical protein